MAVQAKEHIKKSCQCIIFKGEAREGTHGKHIMVTHSLELFYINYLCLEPRKGKEENVLVVIDHFIWYVQVYMTQSQTTQPDSQSVVGQLHVDSTVDCQRRYCLIRGEISKVN